MNKLKSPLEAAMLIPDEATILLTGSGGGGMEPDFVCQGIEQRFLSTGSPKGLTLVHISGVGNREEKGVSRFAHEGMVKRVIGGHWGWSPSMVKLALENKIEAYNLPQGILSLLTREIASNRPGLLTKVGLHTFIDPRQGGGKLNEAARSELVRLIELDGEEYLFYRTFPIQVSIIRGTTADEDGNISMEKEAADLDVLSAAQAAHNSKGIVIAQVKQLAARRQLRARTVKVPGFLVDAVVQYPEQWQTGESEYNVGYSGEYRAPLETLPQLEQGVRRWIARRASMELKSGAIVNLGYGIADGVANIAAEEGLLDSITFAIEQGLIGGVPAKGDIFGACFNPDAVIDAPSQFDFFHGGGIDIAFLGMAQVDRQGNVNVSRFGSVIPGTGGFIDISQNAKKVVFCGTFTAGSLEMEWANGEVKIVKEGKHRKFIQQVEQITFNGTFARKKKQEILYVTERCVFALTDVGLEVVEIAPGVDLQRDILDQMEFRPAVSSMLKKMDSRIYRPESMGLRVL